MYKQNHVVKKAHAVMISGVIIAIAVTLASLAFIACTNVPTIETSTPIPTDDYSTPAPPASIWRSYVYTKTGVSFKYPANWFIAVDEQGDRVGIVNAPLNSMVVVKNYADDLMVVAINLRPINIEMYSSVREFVDTTLRITPPVNILSVDILPTLPQGYSAARVISSGYGETETLYIAKDNHLITIATTYVPGQRPRKKYFVVMEQIAGTVIIP